MLPTLLVMADVAGPGQATWLFPPLLFALLALGIRFILKPLLATCFTTCLCYSSCLSLYTVLTDFTGC